MYIYIYIYTCICGLNNNKTRKADAAGEEQTTAITGDSMDKLLANKDRESSKGGFSKRGHSHFIRKSIGKVSHVICELATCLAPSTKRKLCIRISFADPPHKFRSSFANSTRTPPPFAKPPFDYLSKDGTSHRIRIRGLRLLRPRFV